MENEGINLTGLLDHIPEDHTIPITENYTERQLQKNEDRESEFESFQSVSQDPLFTKISLESTTQNSIITTVTSIRNEASETFFSSQPVTPSSSKSVPSRSSYSLSNSIPNICSKRRKISNVYSDNVEKVIDSLNKPIIVPSLEKKEKDSIDLCMDYVGSIIKQNKNEKERDKLMLDIVQMAISRKSSCDSMLD